MMKKTTDRYCRRAVTLLAAGLWLAGCSDEPRPPLQPGEAEYVRTCATCHSRDGLGRAPNFPPLAGSEWLELGPDAVALIALLGIRGEIEVAGRSYKGYMPSMRQLQDQEITLILEYINQQWADWEGVPQAGEIAALRTRSANAELLEGREALEKLLEEVSP